MPDAIFEFGFQPWAAAPQRRETHSGPNYSKFPVEARARALARADVPARRAPYKLYYASMRAVTRWDFKREANARSPMRIKAISHARARPPEVCLHTRVSVSSWRDLATEGDARRCAGRGVSR